jgi:predicted AlkP superfamily phosphohydrolase/phosphomutase
MKTLVIIVEGMDAVVMHDEIAKGHLPWFADQIERKNYRPLSCGPVPYEPTNLATAFAGVNPGQHGCFSYWASHAGTEMPKILDADDVKAKRVWEWDEMADLAINVVNVQLTHPPKPINGKMISYLMNNSLNASYPRNLLYKMSKDGIRYAHDVSLFYHGEPFEDFGKMAFQIAEYQLQAAIELSKETEIMIVNLTLIDRVSHFLWYELQNDDPANRPFVLAAYDFVDDACRRLQALGAENTLVFSETGFGELTHFVSINDYLEQAGLLTKTADDRIDLDKSVAMEAVQGTHGIMLLSDLYNEGSATYSEIADVTSCLTEATFEDGTPVLSNVRHREDVYSGDHVNLAATLIVEPEDPKRPPLGDPRWAEHVRRHAQSAWHRTSGLVVLDGTERISPQMKVAELEQIAPTISLLSGRDPAKQCEKEALFA